MSNLILVSSSGNIVYDENKSEVISLLYNEFPPDVIKTKRDIFINSKAKYSWGSIDFNLLLFPDGTHKVIEIPRSSFLDIQNL